MSEEMSSRRPAPAVVRVRPPATVHGRMRLSRGIGATEEAVWKHPSAGGSDALLYDKYLVICKTELQQTPK